MLSRRARCWGERLLRPVTDLLVRAGLSANVLTWGGSAATCLVAVTLIPAGYLTLGSLLLGALVAADALDGMVARRTGTASTWGAFLDSTLDRVADAAIFGALTWWALAQLAGPWSGITAAGAILTLAGALIVSYAKARAEAVGLRADVGVAERADRLVVVLVATLVVGLGAPFWVLTLALWTLALACALTVGQRMHAVAQQARASEDEHRLADQHEARDEDA